MSIGSFPLTRGTRSTDLHFLRSERFIPAYAGNSSHFQVPNRIWTVHPCLRGELGSVAGLPWKTRGSSPLTRGTPRRKFVTEVVVRFIPAYAGNSNMTAWGVRVVTVHPRLRGELPKLLPVRALRVGSSPLTRGTQRSRSRRTAENRFIPAYAGNSRLFLQFLQYLSVHPRLRGELYVTCRILRRFFGSSPLTRGTRRPRS